MFRNNREFVCGTFIQRLGAESAYFAKFLAIPLTIDIACVRGWKKNWFEMDSTLTLLNFFEKDYAPRWQLRRRWERYLCFLDGIGFRALHIYRDGNTLVNILFVVALEYGDFTWWNYAIPEI